MARKSASEPEAKADVCPNCGHCPTCGRSNAGNRVYPYPVYPYPYYPWWGVTTPYITVSTGTASSGNYTVSQSSLNGTGGVTYSASTVN